MGHGAALLFDLIAKDGASPAFLKVAGAADKAAAATARAEKGVAGSAAAMSRTGGKLTKSLTLPLLAIGAVSVAQAAKWQKSMTLIQTAGGETAAKTAALSTGLKKLATETGTSLDQLGEGIYTIAKAGAQKWSAVDQLKVMRAAAQGAKAENVDLGTATDALSTVMLDYHVAAGKAVATENQLIRASGLAKTSFGLFSESLSNVTPIAAALGVGFDQVGGAIATMTQHGVSAQQATQNLRNLLFNLSGQNNVASQAMQQLGINTVDLAKNLGRRGLTGTLAIVDRALAEHTRRGMVVVDVHKAAALATRSLSTMLGSMAGPLRKQSKGLLDGSVTIKDYTATAKGLGGVAGASAMQFKSLYLNSLGFSNQLKSGKGTVTTSTAQYAKLLGGMTGASVAMQIGGKYAAENARNVREIGKAALEAGADVLGWDKTQGTLAVKLDKAKASLQVMAVEIGTALIPAVSKVVGWVSTAVHWFDSLSGGTRKFIGVTALAVLALGPLLAIAGRVGKVLGLMWAAGTGAATFIAGVRGAELSIAAMETRSYGAGLKIRSAFANMSTGAKVAGSAISGVMIGTVIGSLTQAAGTATRVGGVIASAALGAATGWAVGGPLGAAVGGISGLLSSAAQAFHLFGGSAKQQVKPTDDFTAAIQRDNDALGSNTRALIANKLSKDGAYDAGRKLGIGVNQLTDAAMGNKQALGLVNLAIESGALSGGKFTDAASKLSGELGVTAETLKVNQRAANDLSAALGGGKKSADDTTGALKALGSVKVSPQIHIDTNDARIRALALVSWLNSLHATVHVTSDSNFGGSVLRTGTTGTGFGVATGGYVTGPGTSTSDSIPARLSNGEFVVRASQASKHRGLLENINKGAQGFAAGGPVGNAGRIAAALRSAFGLTRNQIAGFLGNFQVESRLNPREYNSRENAHGLAQWEGSRWTALQQYARHVGLAATSMAAQTGFMVKELRGSGLIPAIKKMKDPGRVAAFVDANYERSAGTTRGARVAAAQSFAAGGVGGGVGITHDGKSWIYNGIRYASHRAALNAQTRAEQQAAKTSRKARIQSTNKLPSDAHTIFGALSGGVSGMRSAVAGFIKDFKAAGATTRQIARATAVDARLVSNQQKLVAARGLLSRVTSYSDSVRGTLRGTFDPTQYGSVADLVTGLHGQTGQNRDYTREVRKLRREAHGNKSQLNLINTLAASGQSATLEALAGGSRADLANAGKAFRGYNQSVQSGVDVASQTKYGTTQAHEQHVVDRLVERQDRLIEVLARLGSAVAGSHGRSGQHVEHQLNHLVHELEVMVRHGRA